LNSLEPIVPELVEPRVEQEPESIETESVTTNKKQQEKEKFKLNQSLDNSLSETV
jgi:hypothetical protein